MKRPSVRLSVCRIAAATAGGFAAERPAGRGVLIDSSRAQQQRRRSTALGSKCGQCRVDSRGTRLSTQTCLSVTYVVCFDWLG